MRQEKLFLAVIAVLALLFALYNGIGIFLHRRHMGYASGTVVSVWTPAAETMRKNNSKWAVVSYNVNGRHYLSKKRIQIPMYCQIGSVVKICYNKEKPEELYSFSFKRTAVAFAVAVVCIAAAVWRSAG